MLSEEQREKIIERRENTLELFLKTNLSDRELSKRLCQSHNDSQYTSPSTVGRDLTDGWIADEYGKDAYKKVLEIRKTNLQQAKKNGGIASSRNNDYLKDENGHFQGSKAKK